MSADSPTAAAVDYEFGLYRVDSRLRRLYKDGEPLMLTPKAFDTLLALVERHGRVVEKDELMHAVWGDTSVGDDTLAQNISILRRALGDESNRPEFIATVPRRGYRFVGVVRCPSVQPAAPEPAAFRRRRSFLYIVLALCAGIAATIGVFAAQRLSAKKVAPRVVEFTVSEPGDRRFSTEGDMLALSPDGQQLAFVATDAVGSASLWLRPLDSVASRALDGTDGASQPFWSPDSRMVAFFAERRLKAVDVASGTVRVVAWLASPRSLGGTWSRFGEILFSVPDDGMYLVPAAGGTPRRVAAGADVCDGCGSWPSFLPDGRHFLYTVAGNDPSTSGIYVAEIGKAGRQRLLDVVSSCSYAPPGALFYARSGSLYAQPFDAAGVRVTGAPVLLADAIAYNRRTGRVPFSASETGILAFRSTLLTELVWIDRAGRRQNVAARPATYFGFSIAPDGRRIATARLDPPSGTSDVWVLDGERETRVTNDPDWDSSDPVWSEDGDYVAYASRRGNRWRIYRRKATAVAAEELLLDSDTPVIPLQMFRSTHVVYAARAANSSFDVWRLAEGRPTPLLRTGGFYPSDGRLSPGEQWFAYSIPEAIGQTVYVSSPSAPDNRRAIAESASAPRWRADGQELFYLSEDGSVVAVPVNPRGTPSEAPGEMLFRTLALSHSGLTGEIYDVTPDGRRFLMKVEAGSSPIRVILNWEARVGG